MIINKPVQLITPHIWISSDWTNQPQQAVATVSDRYRQSVKQKWTIAWDGKHRSWQRKDLMEEQQNTKGEKTEKLTDQAGRVEEKHKMPTHYHCKKSVSGQKLWFAIIQPCCTLLPSVSAWQWCHQWCHVSFSLTAATNFAYVNQSFFATFDIC